MNTLTSGEVQYLEEQSKCLHVHNLWPEFHLHETTSVVQNNLCTDMFAASTYRKKKTEIMNIQQGTDYVATI